VDLLIALEGEGNCQAIHGNFDTYERMRAMQAEAAPRQAPRVAGAKRPPTRINGQPSGRPRR